MAPPSILVLGLGELGHEVVRSLAEHQQRAQTRIAVLLRSRKPQQLQTLVAWDVQLVTGDVVRDSQEELTRIFASYHTVICCVGMYAPPSTQVKIAQAALAAGVQRYFPWQYGIDYAAIGRNSAQDLFDSQLDVRDLLHSSQGGTSWVIVSTGMFISFLFEPAFGLVDAQRTTFTGIGSWDNTISVTSPRDIGRVVAELALVDTHVQGVVYVAGDTISMGRIADVVERVLGREVRRGLKGVEELKRELAKEPTDAMRKYRVVFAEGRGVAWRKEETYNEAKAMPMCSVEEWARQNLLEAPA